MKLLVAYCSRRHDQLLRFVGSSIAVALGGWTGLASATLSTADEPAAPPANVRVAGEVRPNEVESALPGALVPVRIDDGTTGHFFRAQDHVGQTL